MTRRKRGPGRKPGEPPGRFKKTTDLNDPKKKPKKKQAQKKNQVQKNQRPVIPFLESDRILLVGEGDFSFAHSLATSHGCKRMLATCYDSEETLYEKYPQAKELISQLCSASDSTNRGLKRKREGTPISEKETGSGDESTKATADTADPEGPTAKRPSPQVLFSIDAKKLGLTGGGGKVIRNGFPRLERNTRSKQQRQHAQPQAQHQAQRQAEPQVHPQRESQIQSQGKPRSQAQPHLVDETGPWDKICFNFPHVGGLSTDVNRQVRANQELLVSFFKACIPLLSAPPTKEEEDEWLSSQRDELDDEGLDDDDDDDDASNAKKGGDGASSKLPYLRKEPGQIIVTHFEGEPYTLWNIRDLARHAGLRVVTSFKFPWSSYPGYSHARTLGEIEGKDGERGGWRGEEREARSYVFERKEYEDRASWATRKRKAKDDSDDSDGN